MHGRPADGPRRKRLPRVVSQHGTAAGLRLHSVDVFMRDEDINLGRRRLSLEIGDRLERLRYVNCGHLAKLILRRDGTMAGLESTCTVRDTDGVPESLNEEGEELGEPDCLWPGTSSASWPVEPMVAAILFKVQNFSGAQQHEGITPIAANVEKRNDELRMPANC